MLRAHRKAALPETCAMTDLNQPQPVQVCRLLKRRSRDKPLSGNHVRYPKGRGFEPQLPCGTGSASRGRPISDQRSRRIWTVPQDLRVDGNQRPRIDHREDFFDLGVRHRDTAPRPVLSRVWDQRVLLTVDEDIAPRRLAKRTGFSAIFGVRVTDAERQMKAAIGVPAVDEIRAFRRFSVAFEFLVTNGRKAKFNIVFSECFAVVYKKHLSVCFVDNDTGNFWAIIREEFAVARSTPRQRYRGYSTQ